jgi:aminopeptidase YwaD
MKRFNTILITLGFILSSVAYSQHTQPVTPTRNVHTSLHAVSLTPDTIRLKQHISILSSDEMEGRETGTNGEKLAYEYLSGEFRAAGLAPMGTQGYIQPFPFTAGSYAGENNELKIGKNKYTLNENFYPLAWSANKTFKGTTVMTGHGIAAPGKDDYAHIHGLKGKIFVMEFGYPEGMDPHSTMGAYADIRTRIDSATARGAAAVIFINTDKNTENPPSKISNRISPSSLPVLFVFGEAAGLLVERKSISVSGQTEILKREKTGHNVIGFLNNNAEYTVVIGAHYDHLGYGIEGSLFRGDKHEIHNGADDNASGTAALIELARILQKSTYKDNNYMFIAFSGEEMGLLGSNHLIKHFPVPVEKINYMLNMDMIGRLDEADPVLILNGSGTSPEWPKAFAQIQVAGMKTKTTESGMGPSDHAAFYLRDIPVLHFFSGTHEDYHKPSDDEHKINYSGQQKIMEYMIQLIGVLNKKGKIEFTKTQDSNNENTPRFKVTLGVVPDYAFDGQGMRIDGVSDGKPAQKAGLQAGDIVIKIGEHQVADMMGYMKALSKFSKGNRTTVTVKRGEETITRDIEF